MTSPPVPAEVDLRDFTYMPLELARLRRSRAWLKAKKRPELGFYMVNLWSASWHSVPAGSLEDDDEILADLALCDEAKWKKIRELALYGWVKCSDGRLYHPTVATKAIEAWEAKLAQRNKTANATAARLAKQEAARAGNVPRETPRHEPCTKGRDPPDETRRDDVTSDVTSTQRSPREVEVEVEGREVQKRDVGVTPDSTARAQGADSPQIAIENTEKSRANSTSTGQQWANMTYVNATGKTFGLERRPNEEDSDYKDRVYSAVQAHMTSEKRA